MYFCQERIGFIEWTMSLVTEIMQKEAWVYILMGVLVFTCTDPETKEVLLDFESRKKYDFGVEIHAMYKKGIFVVLRSFTLMEF